ncbi:peptidylprolyl isomerase [Candidatus Symbiobacter mobilis]|uniref:peptidylprolyl isomerase n=1 Tax=Candidatus Symbiobacter mobilis CR TaxID=946483 RepID=U5NA99_9BURK|nr:peptidylprolyl isomerase [Candidatus Symbiobacter mobilis]AGX87114.1 peptidyl-prolyl cis-trans isomerase C [Candidatus Symbiobacter mobilis CR]
MKMKFVAAAVAAVVLGSLHSVAWSQNVAVVNGKAVPKAKVDALSQQIARSGREITPDIEKQIKDEVIVREIFMQEAQRQGLDATEDFQTQIELAKQNILIRELFASYQKAHPATEEEIKAEYDQFVASNSGKEYKARHILVETEEQAKSILAQLKKGAKFDELAKKSSKDPGSAARGGDLGWSPAGNYVAEFSQAMTKLGKGKTSDAPVKSQFGYHIIRVDDVRDAQLPKLEDIKPQVVQRLMQRKLSKYQDELRAKAKIE